MVLGVKAWAAGPPARQRHAGPRAVVRQFLAWAVLAFIASRRRDRREGTTYSSGTVAGTVTAVVAGTVAWAVFAFWLHAHWLGVSPMGKSL